MLHQLTVFQAEDFRDRFAARIIRRSVPVAVKDDVVAVRENALDLGMRVRMGGRDPGDEFPYAFHSVFNERVVLSTWDPRKYGTRSPHRLPAMPACRRRW